MKENCDVCGAPMPPALRLNRKIVQTCEGCFTQYGTKGRVDNTDTLVIHHDCKHRHVQSLIGHRWLANRWNVRLCMDCGQFQIAGKQDGQTYEFDFIICGDEILTAAAKPTRMIFSKDVYNEIRKAAEFERPEYDDSESDEPVEEGWFDEEYFEEDFK